MIDVVVAGSRFSLQIAGLIAYHCEQVAAESGASAGMALVPGSDRRSVGPAKGG
jgi:hypothetical protein